ncbi:MAG: Nif3-like dinuclear metal center hexameric protein [Bacteroidetes bacterium]|nr:Nif3-like dinuclear metal center hexameric protein [Bacteroidota bacterium]
MKIEEICRYLDEKIPPALQENYDNCGVQAGNTGDEATAALITIDVNEEVLTEAVSKDCNLVISHHPLIFSPLKSLAGNSPVQRAVMAAIRNGITVYTAHTNLDSVKGGVSYIMASKMGLKKLEVLAPLREKLVKLVTFIPHSHSGEVKEALFRAGAGKIGNYDSCGYSLSGEGTFRGNEDASPFTGEPGKLHAEPEIRFETIIPSFAVAAAVKALLQAHPYEEPAFDLYPVLNEWKEAGMGVTGVLDNEIDEKGFLELCSTVFSPVCLRHTRLRNKPVRKVALCGGAGGDLLKHAIASGADAFVTADLKYHQFAQAEEEIFLVDPGHYETEKFSVEIIHDLLIKKFPNFALRFSETGTNPINCY